ncbi:MAG: C39 family peptidase [Luteolibacter sp.]|jgi:hypothetical protein
MTSFSNKFSSARGAAFFAVACICLFTRSHADDAAAAFMEKFRHGEVEARVDALLAPPAVWQMNADGLEAAFAVPAGVTLRENPYFKWMSERRDRAVFMRQPFTNLKVNLTAFEGELPLDEVTVDFVDGKLNGIRMSLFNRGDSEDIGAEEFDRRLKLCGRKVGELLGVRPTMRKANYTQGLVTEGWIWVSPHGMALMDYNPEAVDGGDREFLRLWLAPRDAHGIMAAVFQNRPSSARRGELPGNVVRGEEGDVFIDGIPMVDQGPKGYCVVASVQRLFEYYGIPADQHQLAQMAGSDAAKGTSTHAIAEAMGKIDYRFRTRFSIHAMAHENRLVTVNPRQMTVGKEFSEADFLRTIRRSVDSGIPVLWSLILGRFPEIPAISPQTSGGHMRMIIGYNVGKNQVLFSDSWGNGHALKRMDLGHAYHASTGVFTVSPTVR